MAMTRTVGGKKVSTSVDIIKTSGGRRGVSLFLCPSINM